MTGKKSMTPQQRELLQQLLTEAKGKLGDIADLLRTCGGDETATEYRVFETLASLQRLEWALERSVPGFGTPGAGSSLWAMKKVNKQANSPG